MYSFLGKLTVAKANEAGSTFDHTQVQQLVKSRSKEQRLGILLEGQGRKDYMFESLQVCQWAGLFADHVIGLVDMLFRLESNFVN